LVFASGAVLTEMMICLINKSYRKRMQERGLMKHES
jgi:hypothetical protein